MLLLPLLWYNRKSQRESRDLGKQVEKGATSLERQNAEALCGHCCYLVKHAASGP